jgi:NAD(P)H-dependent FMN reductase
MPTPRILAFAGSTRRQSWNKKLIAIAAAAARRAGADVTLIDLADHPLPLYDGDLESRTGLPESARRLKDLFTAHDGLLLSCPEYNSSISGVLKNAIDWVSRPEEGKPPLGAFEGKVAGLMAASTGSLGGLRGLVHVRAILGNIKVIVIPNQVAVPNAPEAFDGAGALRDAKVAASVEKVALDVVSLLRRLNP